MARLCFFLVSPTREQICLIGAGPRQPNLNWEAARGRAHVHGIRFILLLALVLGAPATVQAYPDQPVKIIVPQPPGGGFDTVARILADRLGPLLGQAVVVENRTGAGTLVGTEAAARAPADGYTLLLGALSNIALEYRDTVNKQWWGRFPGTQADRAGMKYMTDEFAATPFLAGFAVALGALTQAMTRFFADQFVERYSPVRVARVLLSVLGLGCVLVFFAVGAWMALLGFGLMGVGTSAIFPLAMSAAAQRRDRSSAINVAALAQISFVAFLLGPPLLGLVAEHYGIRWSFGIGIPLVALSLVAASALGTRPTPHQIE
jgi:hypothetical protein